MSIAQRHVIRRQYFHVELTGSEADGFALQRRLSDLCEQTLMPALEQVFERLSDAEEHLLIDRLEIDAGQLDLARLEHDMTATVTRAVDKELRERAPPAGSNNIHPFGSIERRTSTQSVGDAFVHFLCTGSLPWWFCLSEGRSLENAMSIVLSSTEIASASQWLQHSVIEALSTDVPRRRLVQQFSPAFLARLLDTIATDVMQTLDGVLSQLTVHHPAAFANQRFSDQLWRAAFAAAASRQSPTTSALVAQAWRQLPSDSSTFGLARMIEQQWPGTMRATNPGDTAPQMRDGSTDHPAGFGKFEPPLERFEQDAFAQPPEASDRIDLADGVYVGTAGLVILHPFLPQLFEGLGLASGNQLQRPDRAAGLLHFLATGHEPAPEYELLLPKVLCGLTLEQPVDSRPTLTNAEREEAIALLTAVIRHWNALRDTSIDGLRGAFLVRPGKLCERDDGDLLLRLETQAYDVLLEQLPWGIGAIKLPWMRRMLWVEWS